MQARVDRYRAAAIAPNTTRAYVAQLRTFELWCDLHGIPARLPIPAALIAAWLTDRADQGASRSTIAVALASIKSAHRTAGLAFEATHPVLISAVQGIRRTLINPPRQAAPLKGYLLKDILGSPGSSDVAIRDSALIATLYVFGLRRSELAGLDYGALGRGTGALFITGGAIELVLATSKNHPGAACLTRISRDANPLAFAAVDRWIAHAHLLAGQPFIRRALVGGGYGDRITPGSVARALRSAIARHQLACGMSIEAARTFARAYSGHSGRVGLVTAAKEAGASDASIASATRHADTRMVARYGQQSDPSQTAPHKLPGVGV